ncbi:MAG: M50 family metallopeptidase [Bacteroidota bacterium]
MAWSFPAALMLLWNFIITQQYTFQNFPPIVIGFLGYMLLWFLIFRRQAVGSYISTLEHECTHALFAILTGHSVKALRVTAHSGGQVVYQGGEGNWLIVIAPYFFPTVTFIMLLIRLFIQPNYWFEIGVGVSIAFHIGSTFYETHSGQTDLQKVGRFFSFCFLPTVNILTYTFIAVYLRSGWQGIGHSLLFLYSSVSVYSIQAYTYGYALVVKYIVQT